MTSASKNNPHNPFMPAIYHTQSCISKTFFEQIWLDSHKKKGANESNNPSTEIKSNWKERESRKKNKHRHKMKAFDCKSRLAYFKYIYVEIRHQN